MASQALKMAPDREAAGVGGLQGGMTWGDDNCDVQEQFRLVIPFYTFSLCTRFRLCSRFLDSIKAYSMSDQRFFPLCMRMSSLFDVNGTVSVYVFSFPQ